MSSKPNKQDLADWYELCEDLAKRPRKAAYSSNVKNNYLFLSEDKAVKAMYTWMRQNDVSPIFYNEGWGWRLRKDWRERLESIENM